MCPYIPDDEGMEEEKMDDTEREKLISEVAGHLNEEIVEEHLKASFRKYGIEGSEDIFRRVYANYPKILDLYQKVYNRLIGRT